MIPLPSGTRIFLRLGRTDGRQGINTLSVMAESVMAQNPFSGNLFLFLNKGGNTVKALYWDRNGFCLWMKRLEDDKFHWPEGSEAVRELSVKEWQWLLDGLDLKKLKPHQEKTYLSVI
jgi:transposase